MEVPEIRNPGSHPGLILDAVCRFQNNSANDVVKEREVQKHHSPGSSPGLENWY
jgi:hypothetical protein